MTFIPSHHQRVEIANVVRPVASNLRNVVDACNQTAARYVELSTEAQAEVVKICTVERFIQIQVAAQALQDEFEAKLLAYEGEQGLPMGEATP